MLIKFLKEAIEYVTTCILLPGVQLNVEEVFTFYSKSFVGFFIDGFKRLRW